MSARELSDAVGIVVVTASELRAIVRDAVREALAGTPVSTPEDWLDAGDAAAILRVHRRTVAKMAMAGTLPATRIGRLLRFRRSDVEAYLSGARIRRAPA